MDAREQLIDTTRELLWERGYVGTSPKAIQQRSGVGQGSMYHHFAGKAGLALAAIERSAAEKRAAIEALLSQPGSAVDRLSSYLLSDRDVLAGCPIGRLTQDPVIFSEPELRRPVEELFDWVVQRLARVIEEGQRDEEIDPSLEPGNTAALIVAALQGGYVLARASASRSSFDRSMAGLIGLIRSSAKKKIKRKTKRKGGADTRPRARA